MTDTGFVADPERLGNPALTTGIYLFARTPDSPRVPVDLAQLDRDSVIRYLRSDKRLAVNVVLLLFGHRQIGAGE